MDLFCYYRYMDNLIKSSNDWKDKNLQKAIIKIWDERRICIDLIYDWIFINDGQQKADEQHVKVIYICELWQLKTKKLVENKMTIKGKEAENELKNLENLRKEWKKLEPPIIEIIRGNLISIKNNKLLNDREVNKYNIWIKNEFDKSFKLILENKNTNSGKLNIF
ncbi:unnamed protein product [Meloidogyne enterolobii]|uniref:Uncharacterized protein n=1 Tax=Meloidogyne enterolobii TaxID=390850 RepID=A0ACB0ZF47_MELEN